MNANDTNKYSTTMKEKIEKIIIEAQLGNIGACKAAQQVLDLFAVSSSADRYTKKFDRDLDGDVYTVDEWKQAVKDGCFCNFDGSGYWVKNGLKSRDEVFSTTQLDATHVVWYNK